MNGLCVYSYEINNKFYKTRLRLRFIFIFDKVRCDIFFIILL